ncbi:Mitochondrial copper homeostasis protein [Botryosphaeria dothidea]
MAGDGKAESPWTDSAAATFDGKQYSQYFDPCQEAASRSLRCLHRNGGDKDLCADYFQYVRPQGESALAALLAATRSLPLRRVTPRPTVTARSSGYVIGPAVTVHPFFAVLELTRSSSL